MNRNKKGGELIQISEPSLLIRINKAYHGNISEEDLYDYTRAFWKLKIENARKAEIALSVYEGVIQEVYEIQNWFEYDETKPNFRINDEEDLSSRKGRIYFEGRIASHYLRDKYRYKSVKHYFKKGSSNPVMYLNIKG